MTSEPRCKCGEYPCVDPAPADQLTDEQAARILAAVDHPELDPLLEAGRQGEYEVALTEAIEADKADHA